MRSCVFFLLVVVALLPERSADGATIVGHVRDQNWYARPTSSDPFGVGQYEFAVNANGTNISALGGFDDTDVFGAFSMLNVGAGSYTVASWDVWWRSAYVFNVPAPASGNTADVDLRIKATMWGYPAFWDPIGYTELGQTFVASGSVAMMYLRLPGSSGTYTLTVRTNGPIGTQIGQSRTFGVGDQRPIWGYGQMPTIPGGTYYVRIRPATANTGIIMQMDPRPDYSDPMPGGCLWLGNSARPLAPYPDRDLGLTIMSDDDGLITDMFTRFTGGTNFSGMTSVGQTFIARGVNLISAAFWLADGTFPTFVVRLLENGPGGAQVGTVKRNRPARPTADPEMIVTWAPGECPIVAGQTYYLEITKEGGGTFNSVLINTSNPFEYGQAYKNGAALPTVDLAGTIMEEESVGSATRPTVKIASDAVAGNRGTNSLTITWNTDVASDSLVEFAPEAPPYSSTMLSTQLVTAHSLTITGLQSHTMYHYRVTSARDGYRPGISRDFVICTRPAGTNLLLNPDFEEGTGNSPRSTLIGWTKAGTLDTRTSSGNWFGSFPPTNGAWLLEAAVHGNGSDSFVYQRISNAVPGAEYTFSAWTMTAMQELINNVEVWKYDVWNLDTRLCYMRLGIDPTGGTTTNASTVQWTPRFYSHRHYIQLAKTVTAQSSNLTVFIHFKGDGGAWHIYGADDCALTREPIPTAFQTPALASGNLFQSLITSRANRSNTVETSISGTNGWSVVTNFLNRNGSTLFNYPVNTNDGVRFFRARVP